MPGLNPGTCEGKLTADPAEAVKATPLINVEKLFKIPLGRYSPSQIIVWIINKV